MSDVEVATGHSRLVRAVPVLQLLALLQLVVLLMTPEEWYGFVPHYREFTFFYLAAGGALMFLTLFVGGEVLQAKGLQARTSMSRAGQICAAIGLGITLAFAIIFNVAALLFSVSGF
jgi:hypothetical protein